MEERGKNIGKDTREGGDDGDVEFTKREDFIFDIAVDLAIVACFLT